MNPPKIYFLTSILAGFISLFTFFFIFMSGILGALFVGILMELILIKLIRLENVREREQLEERLYCLLYQERNEKDSKKKRELGDQIKATALRYKEVTGDWFRVELARNDWRIRLREEGRGY